MPERRKPASFVCKGCGKVITRDPSPARDNRREYCNNACKLRVFWNKRQAVKSPCRRCGNLSHSRHAHYCGGCRIAVRADGIARRMARRIPGLCVVCSQPFVARGQRSCGNPLCRGELIRRALIGQPKNFVKVDRSCSQCGCSFLTVRGRLCKRCIKRNLKKRTGKCGYTRAKLRGLPRDHSVTQMKVFERDNWTCQLCGVRIPKRFRGTNHDRAPSVDHIIPLSNPASPGHVWHNVQCVCRGCNQRKSAHTIGQLRLAM